MEIFNNYNLIEKFSIFLNIHIIKEYYIDDDNTTDKIYAQSVCHYTK